MSFCVFSDSSCDLTPDMMKQFGIDFVPFYVTFDSEKYHKEHVELSTSDFYKMMKQSTAIPKTSLPTVSDYCDAFREKLSEGRDILCLCLTQKFSGSYQSAVSAAKELETEFPERKILIIDSIQATGGQGIVVLQAARMRNDGYSIEKTKEVIEKLKQTAKIYFTVDSLEHLRRGGRIGLASSLLGGMLGIKPLIMLDKGELLPHSKCKGRKKAIAKVVSLVKEDAANPADYDYIIIHSDILEEGLAFFDDVSRQLGITPIVSLVEAGVTIGSHVGPTALGIAFIRKYETML